MEPQHRSGRTARPPARRSPGKGRRQKTDQRGRDERGGQQAVDRHVLPGVSPSTRDLLRHFGLSPRKAFGQNFLVDEDVLGTIVEAAEIEPDDQVVEVGPGLGVLTAQLLDRARRVVAVEIDRGMAGALSTLFPERSNLTVVNEDILSFDPATHLDSSPYKVVANLPYYITSPTLRRFLESPRQPVLLVVMVQREVAERIVAAAGDLSLLAISVQYYGVPRLIARVPRLAFYPAPKVESAILRIDVRPAAAVSIPADKFFRVVSAGFAHQRKQIHNALSRVIWMPPDAAAIALEAAGIDGIRRAQTLSLDEWGRLTTALDQMGIL